MFLWHGTDNLEGLGINCREVGHAVQVDGCLVTGVQPYTGDSFMGITTFVNWRRRPVRFNVVSSQNLLPSLPYQSLQ